MSRSTQSIIIIGAGIGGLSAGCYGQMNGFETRIFEMHRIAGGLCTGWRRKGYMFDGCIHFLWGSDPGIASWEVWADLGAVQGREMVYYDEMMRYRGTGGKTLILYTDIDRLEQHLVELAPADEQELRAMCADIRAIAEVDVSLDNYEAMSAREVIGFVWSALPLGRVLQRYKDKASLGGYARSFKDPFMREAFEAIVQWLYSQESQSVVALLSTMGICSVKKAGYPIGGSLRFAQAIAKRYRKLGGKLQFSARVETILVEDDRAIGVRLEDGSEHFADVVISAADGYATIFNMLGGKYANDQIRKRYDESPVAPPMVQVSIGVDMDLSAVPHCQIAKLEQPCEFGGHEQTRTGVIRHYAYDPTMAPAGKTALNMIRWVDFDYWREQRQDTETYAALKDRIAEQAIAQIEQLIPGFAAKVEVVDVATPTTIVDYTGNRSGSVQGWLLTPESSKELGLSGIAATLPGLDNFYMAGQWVGRGGGLPTVAASGRGVIRMLCKQAGKEFTSSRPELPARRQRAGDPKDRLVALPGGRELAICDSPEAGGFPVFLLSTMPAGCRLDVRSHHQEAHAAGLRLIGVDRPGIGRSTPHAEQTLDDWARDMEALADALELEVFGILAHGTGCSFGLAAAHALPERVAQLVLVAPAYASKDSPTQGARLSHRMFGWLARHAPSIFEHMLQRMIESSAADPDYNIGDAFCEVDRLLLKKRPELERDMEEGFAEATRAGVEGMIQDAILSLTPFPFQIAEIEIPIQLWHGEEDANSPVAIGRRIAELLPHAEARFLAGEGHLSLTYEGRGRVLAALAEALRRAEPSVHDSASTS